MALLWMHKHGFAIDTKSSKYVDGHENPEVLLYREKYLARMAELAPRILYRKPSQAEIDGWVKIKKEDPRSKELPIIPLSQDESTAWAADFYRGPQWTEKDKPTSGRFHEKSKGSSIMISGYFDPVSGGILYSEDGRSGMSTIEAGGDNWWTSQKMCDQLKTVLELYMETYPWAQFLFLFDWSSCHTAKTSGAPSLNNFNLSDGGKQPFCRDQIVEEKDTPIQERLSQMAE